MPRFAVIRCSLYIFFACHFQPVGDYSRCRVVHTHGSKPGKVWCCSTQCISINTVYHKIAKLDLQNIQGFIEDFWLGRVKRL